jgi:predicted ribonuclease YlaK
LRICVRPSNETRRRLVLDTNVFLNNGFEAGAVTDFLERLEISRCLTDKALIPYVVLEELEYRKRSQEEYPDTAKRAREVFRYLTAKFTEQNSFWELQRFEIDAWFKHRIHNTPRAHDLRIFFFVRACERQRPGGMALVTDDQMLRVEMANEQVHTMSYADVWKLLQTDTEQQQQKLRVMQQNATVDRHLPQEYLQQQQVHSF